MSTPQSRIGKRVPGLLDAVPLPVGDSYPHLQWNSAFVRYFIQVLPDTDGSEMMQLEAIKNISNNASDPRPGQTKLVSLIRHGKKDSNELGSFGPESCPHPIWKWSFRGHGMWSYGQLPPKGLWIESLAAAV